MRVRSPSLFPAPPRLQVGRPLFLALYDYFKAKGGIYKLAFGTHPSRIHTHIHTRIHTPHSHTL